MKKKWMGGLLALTLAAGSILEENGGDVDYTRTTGRLDVHNGEAYARRRGVHPLDGRESP